MSRRRRTGSVKAADSTDARVGRNTRIHRLVRPMSQADLAGRIEGTFQQVRLVRAFARIRDRNLRRSIVAMVERIAAKRRGLT